MKSIFKFLKIIIFSFLIILTCYYLGMSWIKHYSWRNISTEKEMMENGVLIKNSPRLPEKFYIIYDKIRPFQRNTTMKDELWNSVLRPHSSHNCKCDDIGGNLTTNSKLKTNMNQKSLSEAKTFFGFGLEKYSNPQKCFDFWMNNSIIYKGKHLKNLNELSQLILEKDIQFLTDLEIVKLIAWHDMLLKGIEEIDIVNKRYELLLRIFEGKRNQ